MSQKILIVDDEMHIRMLLEQTLEELQEDFDVTILIARDGREGLDAIRRDLPDLVFLDVMMPGLNGYEVCRAVREDPACQTVSIVLLTAKGQDLEREQGLRLGALRYITKPFDPDEILELAKKMLKLE